MKYSIFLLFALLFQVTAGCQTDTTVIPFSARWKVGDHQHFTITKVKKTWQSNKLVQNDSTRYVADFRVMDADTGSYTIMWKFKNLFLDAFKLSEPSYNKLARVYDSTTVIYKTDEHGAFLEIFNWQEISMMMTDLINEAINTKSSDTHMNREDLKKAFMPLLSVYSSKRGIEQLVFSELLMFHFPFGKQYTKGEFYNYEEQLPIMQNTGPATGNGVIFIRKFNHHDKTCELVQRLKILPDSAKKFLTQYLKDTGVLPGAIESTLKVSKVEINDNNIFQYKYDPGIPVHIIVSRETLINVLEDKIKQINQTIIERVSD